MPSATPFTAAIVGLRQSRMTSTSGVIGGRADAELGHRRLHAGVAPRRLDVVAGAERLARPGEDHDPHVRRRVGVAERGLQLLTELERRGVRAGRGG